MMTASEKIAMRSLSGLMIRVIISRHVELCGGRHGMRGWGSSEQKLANKFILDAVKETVDPVRPVRPKVP